MYQHKAEGSRPLSVTLTVVVMTLVLCTRQHRHPKTTQSISGNLDLHFAPNVHLEQIHSVSYYLNINKSKEMLHKKPTPFILLLILSGDIQTNPGPQMQSIYPCGFCERAVGWENKAVCCDGCDIWYHMSCLSNCSNNYETLQHSSVSWICAKCDSINVDSFTFHAFQLELSNPYSPLQTDTQCASSPTLSDFIPVTCSSPCKQNRTPTHTQSRISSTSTNQSGTTNTDTFELPKKENLRTMVINCQSLRWKTSSFHAAVEYAKPDVIIGNESWLDSTIGDSEIFPPNYVTYRKDRDLNGGGVFIAVQSCYTSILVPEADSGGEIIWIKLHLKSHEDMYIGSYYRPPDHGLTDFRMLETSLKSLPHQATNKTLILGGDFNLPDIDWELGTTKPSCKKVTMCNELIELAANTSLTQIQEEVTRVKNNLDLLFTNRPGLIKSCYTLPGIGDHDIVIADADIKAKIEKTKPRKILQFNKCKWEDVQADAANLTLTLLEDFDENDIDKNWNNFKNGMTKLIDQHIPSKISSTRFNLPWLDNKCKRMIHKKHKLYKKAKKTKKTKHMDAFKKLKLDTKIALKQAKNKYVSNTLHQSLENKNSKPFWNFIKQQRKDNTGIAPLKPAKTTTLITDNKLKAEVLNKQFKSVFTKENPESDLRFVGNKTNSIGTLTIQTKGVTKLLQELSPSKASGPDNIPNRILKETATQISPFITKLFNQSLQIGKLPKDWNKANVTPIYKKGNRQDPANYRPVSLTCVSCKLMEHILCKHILSHLETHNILTDRQHGFRSGHSCESQLLITTHDIIQNIDKKIQTDVIILDFSKAFDTVPHSRLLAKLDHYGIDGPMNKWIAEFLNNRTQSVLVNGETSSPVSVDSGVPQGSVLGPLLFLCHINDLPDRTKSTVRMFADDCLLYRQIQTPEDHIVLENDLKALGDWANMWGMKFNATKCYVMTIGRQRKLSHFIYTLCNHPLENVKNNPYLGIQISNDLKWKTHIDKTCNKSNKILGFLRRNLKHCPTKLKETAYKSLVRSIVEYSATIWDPYLKKDTIQVEKIQRRAARFVCNDYRQTSSVSAMLDKLKWQPLEQRRRSARITLLYKILTEKIAIEHKDYITFNTSSTRAGSRNKLDVYSPQTETSRNSFFPRTVKDWNQLNFDPLQSKDINELRSKMFY